MTETVANPSPAIQIENGTFCEDGHIYRNTQKIRVPSSTQVLAFVGLVDFSRVSFETLKRKRQIGLAVHAACEFIDTPEKGELDWEFVDEACVPYILAYEKFCREMQFKPVLVEKAGVSKSFGMEFGYRVDRVGTVGDGIPAIIELKCGYKEEISWPLQLASYELTLPKLPAPELFKGVKVDPKYKSYLRVAVQLKKDASFRAHSYEKPSDQKHFLSALSLTWFKMNSKIALPDIPDDAGIDEEEL